MTYDEAIAFWYGRIDYERRQPRPGDLKLDRMRSLLRRLGDPHRRVRCVHVAGTKGKGSTSAMLAGILRKAGHRTGLFTSPHLADISERVQVDGVPISPAEMAARMGEVAVAVRAMDALGDHSQSPTFFEVITALGFLHFDCRRVDMAVIEVGLGGRFDSTNVCEPLLTIITNISYDHLAILGHTLGEIAFQKGGIIKREVPVVSTADEPEAAAVIAAIAKESHAPLWRHGRDFSSQYRIGTAGELPRTAIETPGIQGEFSIGLIGSHQAVNASGAVMAADRLRVRGLGITDTAIREGLRTVSWPARQERLAEQPTVVLDCAHNVASTKVLVETLQTSYRIDGRWHLIFAASNDKQIREMLAELVPVVASWHLTRYVSNPRSADPNQMAEWLAELGATDVRIHADPEAAWQFARRQLTPADGLAVTGSVFLAGELRPTMVRDCQS
ncbi:bifunctional folylpolyglutamate synthase/dihydrofolate synthase [Zavarzinella formosa]|uniref:bifunctional folylpolyglutamate synthase/dihydrofolate synthase n=1 Tax=Zavarzinella formosa TaxID=360055 RepID=UPI00031E0D3C|nr:folylpolyglutamate synthase/dihydrofolate synthase family protein [Zavarzinella formosa]